MKLTFRIDILSDYHIGTGYGKGVIDSVLLKDRDGFPIIRGTTITGLLRQGMWDILQLTLMEQHRKCKQSGASGSAYCVDEERESLCPVCRILGSPKYPKKWSISSAQIENPSILKPEKIVWRNRVNLRLRTAEEKKLFSEEIFGGKAKFIFTVTNEADDKDTLEEAVLIVAAFRMVRSLGTSRRRGRGDCRFHLVDLNSNSFRFKGDKEDELLKIFQAKWLENKELSLERSKHINQKSNNPSVPKSFKLVLLTKEPLLIANRSESGNRFQSIDYIPGYTILGAFAWKAANRCDLTNKVIYNKFIKLFRRGGIKVTPLYPCSKIENDIYPSIPSPLDFLTCKLYPGFEENDGHGIKGFAISNEEPKHCDKCLSEKKLVTPLKPLNKFIPLYEPYDERNLTVEVAKREEMHITIDPKTGRTQTGDLFSYTVIESKQYFIGMIEIENWSDFVELCGIEDFQNKKYLELRIGKAASRGYGLSQIWLDDDDKDDNDKKGKRIISKTIFLGKPIEERIRDLSKPITMTLITDTILVDKWGRFLNTLDKETLERILGVEVEIINTYVKAKNIDGFNVHLGLPKWRDRAIVAGSAVGFKIKQNSLNNQMDMIIKRFKNLEEQGIGLRKSEGFGRVAFNHPIYEKDADVGVKLPEYMRISEQEKTVREFELWWYGYLTQKFEKSAFLQDEWRAVSIWLRENSKETIKIECFHDAEEIKNMVDPKQSHREKKVFLLDRSKGQKGQSLLSEAFKELSDELNEYESTLREYLKTRAIEMLADFIESLRGVEE